MKKFHRNRLTIPTALLLFSILFSISFACKKSDEKPGSNQVFMQNTAFNPSSITVSAHTTITWTNKDGMKHTVSSDANLFESGNLDNGGTFSHKFDSVGTFPYHCKLHSGMTAKVIVQ